MKNVKSDAEALVEGAKEKYKKDMARIQSKEEELDARGQKIVEKESLLDAHIELKATKIFLTKKESLEREYKHRKNDLDDEYDMHEMKLAENYKKLTLKHEGMFFVTILYGLLVTLLQIIQKPIIRKDFMNMVGEMVLFGKGIYQGTLTAGLFVAKLGDMIPNDIFSKITHWILLILVMVTVLCGLGALIVIGLKKYVTFVYKSQKDKITAIAGIVVLAIGLYLSDVIKSILSINIIVLMLVLFMGYTIVRALIELRKVELGKKRGMYLLVGVIGLGIYVLLIHFWGCIPAVAVPIGCLFAFEEQ